MKIKLFVCFMVMCLFLTGCFPGTKYTGDMDKALNHLKWQDYESAFGEANAFLERVPHSDPAKMVRQTAAWNMLDIAIENDTEIKLKNGVAVKTSDGLIVSDLPENEDEDFYLVGYKIETYISSNYYDMDIKTDVVCLDMITLHWKYTGSGRSEYEYGIGTPERLNKEDIGDWLLDAYYSGDKLSSDTHEEFVEYLQTALVSSLEEVFAVLENEHNLKPEHIGFEDWNKSA